MISFRPTILLGLTFLMLAGFWLAPIQSQAQSSTPNQPTIERAWYARLADWTTNLWHTTVNWIIGQGSQIARAFTRQTETPAVANPINPTKETLPEKPQVLGEETTNPPPISPITTPAVRPAPTPKADHPPASPADKLIKEGTPAEIAPPQPVIAPAPITPITTPEILAEPVKAEETRPKQNSSYFIPILARDTVAPTSQITAFAAASTATPGSATSSPFTVAWTGVDTDITGSPAVASFDIQYQVDSGAWQDWLLETTLLTSSFTSQDEKNYGFRSRARDRYGNLESYPSAADASIYSNLSIPTTPSVTSHNSGQTLLSTTADEDLTSGSTVQVTLSGSGDIGDVLTITLAETSTTASTTIDNAGHWSKQFTLAEGANNFTLRTQEADGDQSSSALFLLNLEMVPTREVVINEIAWMGSATDTGDEWIELYNASSTAISLAGWTVAAADGSPSFTISSGTIAAKSYFLMERFDDTTVFDVTADFVYSGSGSTNQMGNSGELLTLRDSTSKLIDKVGSSTAPWFAGSNITKATMERKDPASDGTLAASWASNDGTLVNGKASDNSTALTATPKSLNSVNTTIPRSVTDLQIQYIYTTPNSFRLYWTTPKTANLATTTPASYDLRYSTSLITDSNFSAASPITTLLTPAATTGTIATTTASGLATSTAYYFAVKTNNGANDSGLSNVYRATTNSGSYTQLAGYPGSSSATLASSTSPYYVTATMAIPNNMTLTIQPGTVVKLAPGASITFGSSSTLIMGTASDTVNAAVVTSRDDNTYNGPAKNGSNTIVSDGTPGAGDWGNIIGGTSAVATINHGIISYGGSASPMLSFNAGTVTINNSIIRYSNNHGIIVGGASTSLTIANSYISNTLDVGIGVTASSTASITGNTITANRRGISVDTPAAEGSITITGNNFYANNATTGDSSKPISGLHYADIQQLTAQNNWWGRAAGPTTSSPDGDSVTDAAMATGTGGSIDYSNPAASAFSILPSGL